MKDLRTYIFEADKLTPAITKFYRANIGKMNNKDGKNTRIGDVTELTFKYHSIPCKEFVYGEPRAKKSAFGTDWYRALDIKTSENVETEAGFKKYLAKINAYDKFFQYFIEKEDAEKVAKQAKKEYESTKWTLESLLNAIKADKDLMSLKNNYHITNTYQNRDKYNKLQSIYVNGMWRIFLKDNKIMLERASWHTYQVPNLQSLYKILNSKDSEETMRHYYSIVE